MPIVILYHPTYQHIDYIHIHSHIYLYIHIYICKVPYSALAKGELSVEVCGLPEGIKFKDLSEIGEAALTKIIDHFDRIEFVKKASLDKLS